MAKLILCGCQRNRGTWRPEKNWQLLFDSVGLRRWLGGKESACNTGHIGSIPGLGRSPGGGNGNHSSIVAWKNPMDRGAWWAIVYGVANSQTWLSDWACKIIFKEYFIIGPFPHGHVAHCTLYNTLQHFLQHCTFSHSHSVITSVHFESWDSGGQKSFLLYLCAFQYPALCCAHKKGLAKSNQANEPLIPKYIWLQTNFPESIQYLE